MIKKFILLLFIYFLSSSFVNADEEHLIIFDASLSMGESIGNTPKYVAAASAAENIFNILGKDKKVGLRIIGITFDTDMLSYLSEPDKMCRATKLSVPVSYDSHGYISDALSNIFPLGVTPLTYSIRTALDSDFTRNAQLKHIILITDGGESCNADPCSFVSTLMKNRNDVKIDIVAIGVDANDYGQLKCLADATGGKIVNVQSVSELNNAFPDILTDFNNPAKNFPSSNIDNNNVKKETQTQSGIIYRNYLIETYN